MSTTSSAPQTNIEAVPTTVTQSVPVLESMDKTLADLDNFIKTYKELNDQVKASIKELSNIKTSFQKSRREVEKGLKKKSKSSKRVSDPTRPTGFKKPIPISLELAKFLKVDPGELMSRTAVTKSINSYIKDHNLQNPEAKREFDLKKSPEGKALEALLKPKADAGPVSYFNLQKWLAPHFPKEEKPNSAEDKSAQDKPAEVKTEQKTGGTPKRRPALKK